MKTTTLSSYAEWLPLPEGVNRISDISTPQLAELANDKYIVGDLAAKHAVRAYLTCGLYLNEMRRRYPGDKEFGKAVKEKCPDISQNWRTKLMRTAMKYWGDDRAVSLPITTLAELSTAPEDVQEEVLDTAADPDKKTPTRKEVTEAKNSSQSPETEREEEPPEEKEINPLPGVASLPKVDKDEETVVNGPPIGINLEKFTINYLRQDLEYRLYHSDTDDSKISGNKLVDCWMVMGFPPNPEYLPNKQMVVGVYETYKEQLAQSTDKEFVKEAQAKLEACFEEVMSEYE